MKLNKNMTRIILRNNYEIDDALFCYFEIKDINIMTLATIDDNDNNIYILINEENTKKIKSYGNCNYEIFLITKNNSKTIKGSINVY